MVKHAHANIVEIQITKLDKKLNLSISDDGCGFDLSKLKHSKGIGWKNIQSRINLLNGKFSLSSRLGEGTSVNIKLSQLED
jgi:signal transduction histidine kinase